MYNFMYKLETTNFTDLAIVHKNEQLTYGQLLTKSKIIGNCLKNCMGKPIRFYLHNKINVVSCMLGIWYSNNFYVPIDKNGPDERIRYIIKNTGISVILTDTNDNYLKSIVEEHVTIININNVNNINVDLPNVTEELAYVIYTSGTTGLPNGVMIKKSSLDNLILGAIKTLDIKQKSKILNYTSVGLMLVVGICSLLLSHSTLYIASDEHVLCPPDLHEFINVNKINMVTTTPAFF